LLIAFIAVLFALSFFLQQMYFTTRVQAVSTTILISEFRTRGPSGASDEFVELYNAHVDGFKRQKRPLTADEFVDYSTVKWSRNLKRHMVNGKYMDLDLGRIRPALVRPFTLMNLYFSELAVDERGLVPRTQR